MIILHGLATNLAFGYLHVAPALASSFRVTVFDLRGHGKSDMPASGYSIPYHAFDLYGLMDQLGLSRAHLVGHSFGGEIALYFAALFPHRVRSITLADARVRPLQPHNRLRDWPNMWAVKKELERLGISVPDSEREVGQRLLEEFARSGRHGLLTTFPEPPPATPAGFGAWGERSAERWLHLLRTTNARNDFASRVGPTENQLKLVEHPTLAIYGEWSPCLPSLRALERVLPRCRSVMVPRVGHFHPMVRPAVFAGHLRGFLDSVETLEPKPADGRQQVQAGNGERPGRRSPRAGHALRTPNGDTWA